MKRQAKDVARFLWQAPNVNKASLGDYLAERDPFNQQVLAEFVQFIGKKALYVFMRVSFLNVTFDFLIECNRFTQHGL